MQPFGKNARVCFIGDSITQANTFVMYVMRHYLVRFPHRNVTFFNCGIAGGSSETLLAAYPIDVKPHRPTHAVVMLGVNDSGREILQNGFSKETHDILRARLNVYKENLCTLCDMLAEDNVKIALCTPPPIDEYTPHPPPPLRGGYALMRAYADFVRSLAAERGYPLCDVFAHFSREMCEHVLYGDDRIHPNERGQACIASCILEAQGEEDGTFLPLSPALRAYCADVIKYREIICAEHLLLKSFSLTYAEGARIISNKLQTEELSPFFKKLAAVWLECKPERATLAADLLAAQKSLRASFGEQTPKTP